MSAVGATIAGVRSRSQGGWQHSDLYALQDCPTLFLRDPRSPGGSGSLRSPSTASTHRAKLQRAIAEQWRRHVLFEKDRPLMFNAAIARSTSTVYPPEWLHAATSISGGST